jgi:hypothetical protein
MTAQPFALTETPASIHDRLRLLWPACFVIFFAWFSWQIGGDGSPDFRAYHLYNGYAAATGGRPGDIAGAQLQTYFFPGLDWGYYGVFRALDAHPALLRVLLGLPYAAAAWAVFAIGRAALPAGWPARTPLAAALALFGVTGAAGFATIGTTMSDIVPGLPVLAAASLWLAARGAPAASLGRRRLSALAGGALCGVATGLKLTCAPLFAGLLIAVFVGELPRWREAAAFALLFLVAGIAVTFAIAGWWWAHNYATLGNPIFPAFNNVFRSDLVDHGRWSDDRFKPRTWKMALFYPAYWAFRPSRWAIELPMRDPRMLIGLGSALAVLLASARPLRPRPRGGAAQGTKSAAVFVAVFFLAGYVLWEIQFSIYRYLAVIECLSGALAAAALAAWVPRRRAAAATAGLVVVGIAAVASTRYPWWDRSLPSARVLQVAVPAIPPDSMVIFLDPYAMSYTVPFLPASVRVIGANTNLVHPGDAGLLQRRIETAIRTHQGPLWGMEDTGDYPGVADATLAYYGLRRAGDCVLIRTNIERPRITACPLGRTP